MDPHGPILQFITGSTANEQTSEEQGLGDVLIERITMLNSSRSRSPTLYTIGHASPRGRSNVPTGAIDFTDGDNLVSFFSIIAKVGQGGRRWSNSKKAGPSQWTTARIRQCLLVAV